MEPYQISYMDFYDELRITLNLERFRKLSENHRRILMQAFIRVLCRHSEHLPSMRNSVELKVFDRTPTYPGQTFTKFCKSLREFHRNKSRTSTPQPIKIELSCLPTPDFVFSQKPHNIPDFYKTKNEVPEIQSALPTQFPVNVLLGNVNIFKYFNAIRYLGQPSTISSASPQIPVQSYITYLWGAAIDQYYQVALQNNL